MLRMLLIINELWQLQVNVDSELPTRLQELRKVLYRI